ncbi:MAG: hypothetical protein U9Q15_04425 [Patescibacteria group bacterium]|nr:hypothetical protein [Patescibacteria group bacterium]
MDTLLEFLLHEDRLVSLHTKKMTSVIQHSIVEDLNRLLQHKVLHKVLEILSQYDHQISQVEDDQLHKLHHLFTLIDKIEEVEKIEKELEKRSVK